MSFFEKVAFILSNPFIAKLSAKTCHLILNRNVTCCTAHSENIVLHVSFNNEKIKLTTFNADIIFPFYGCTCFCGIRLFK